MPEGKSKSNIDIEIKRLETEPKVSPPKRRQTYYIRVELHEKVRAHAYQERKKISEVVNEALAEFFFNREVKKIPS